MSPVAAPADKRFRRAHVKPGRRRRWRSLVGPIVKYALIILVPLYGAYRGGLVVAHAGALQIDHIVVSGNTQLSTGEVLAAVDGMRGESILFADLAAWRERLLSSPWVKDARFRRSLPSTIEVVVAERQPIGLARMRDTLYLVDELGGIIDEYGPPYADFDLPIVDGLSEEPRTERAALAARLLLSVRAAPEVAEQVSQINVRDLHNAAVILDGDPTLVYVGVDRFVPRLQLYLQLASTLRASVPEIDYVDVRFEDHVYVRPIGEKRVESIPVGPN